MKKCVEIEPLLDAKSSHPTACHYIEASKLSS
jgi:hypothetical protein